MESNSDFHARKSRFLKITYNLRFTIINQQQISEIARIESRFLLAKNAQLKILIRPVCGLLRDRWLLHSVLVWHQWPMTFWILYGPTQAPSTETQKCTFPHFWNIFEQFWWHIQRAAAESFHTVLISFIYKKKSSTFDMWPSRPLECTVFAHEVLWFGVSAKTLSTFFRKSIFYRVFRSFLRNAGSKNNHGWPYIRRMGDI